MESLIKVKAKGWLCALASGFLLCTFSFQPAKAQTFAEFFSQKKKQRQYLLEQIAALEVYAGYVKKGYDIVGTGLNTIKGFKNGEFGLHTAFYNSLKAASPAIRNNAKVAEIIAFQIAITKAFNGIGNHELLSDPNRQYIADVRQKVMDECASDLEELLLVITSGKVEMTDDERIERLDKVYGAMRDKSAFTQKFTGDVGLLIKQKESEQRYINEIRRYYEP